MSANNNGSLIESEKCEAYDFHEIVEYIFPRKKPTSADAMLIRNTNIFLIEFKRFTIKLRYVLFRNLSLIFSNAEVKVIAFEGGLFILIS